MNTELTKKQYITAVEQCRSSQDSRVKISSNLNAGTCLISLGEYKIGLEYLNDAKAVVKGLHISSPGVDESGLDLSETQRRENSVQDLSLLEMGADVYFNSGVALQCLNEYKRAVLDFKSCIDLYLRAGSKGLAAGALTCLGVCYRDQCEMDNELHSLSSARHLYSELSETAAEALVCVDIAKTLVRGGRQDEGLMLIEDSQALYLKINDKCSQGKLQFEYGVVYTSTGCLEDAITCFRRSLSLLRAQRSPKLEAAVLQNIGAVYNDRGMYAEAIHYHKEAISLYGKSKNYDSQSKCLCNLAFAQTQLKNFSNAAHTFKLAVRKAKKTNNDYLLFQANEGLGAVCYHMGRYQEAMDHFRQCLETLDSITEDTGIARERVMEKLSDVVEALQKATHQVEIGSQRLDHTPPTLTPPSNSIKDGEIKTPVRKYARVVRIKRHHQTVENKRQVHHQTVENRQEVERCGSYDADITAYMQTYQESVTLSSEPSSSDFNQAETNDSIMTYLPPPLYVGEGSLALGIDTRELYTTKTVSNGGKHKTEIVLIKEDSNESFTATTVTNRTQQSVRSRVCNIL